jgi:tetratricopeptide (TPR) repeat protein
MLDTLRLLALEQLNAAGDGERVRRAHAEFYLQWVSDARPGLCGPDEDTWAHRIDAEEPNLHAALAWAAQRDRDLALRLAIALWPYWDLRSRERHAVTYFTSVLDPDDPSVPAEVRAWALTAMAELGANSGEARLATQWAAEAVRLFRAAADDRGLAAALMAAASAYGNEGALDAADQALAEAMPLARRPGGAATLIARCLYFQSYVAMRRGDYTRAEQLSRQELAAWSAIGSRRREANALRHIAVTLQHLGQLAQAKELCDQALTMWHECDDPAAIAHGQSTLADLARLRGDFDDALRLYQQASAEFRTIGDRRCTASTYKNLAVISSARGDHARSTGLFLEAVRLRHELGDYAGLAECFDGLAGNVAAAGRDADQARLLAAAEQARSATGRRSSLDQAVAFALDLDRRSPANLGAT